MVKDIIIKREFKEKRKQKLKPACLICGKVGTAFVSLSYKNTLVIRTH